MNNELIKSENDVNDTTGIYCRKKYLEKYLSKSFEFLQVQALRDVALLSIQSLLLGLHEIILSNSHTTLSKGQQTSLGTDSLDVRT